MLATGRKLPVSGGAEKRSYVRGMFHAIAPSYDFLNHLLSLNLDKRWRRKAVERLRHRYGQLLRQVVAQTVDTPEEIDAELRHLRVVLAW